jgi:hypothetical protein
MPGHLHMAMLNGFDVPAGPAHLQVSRSNSGVSFLLFATIARRPLPLTTAWSNISRLPSPVNPPPADPTPNLRRSESLGVRFECVAGAIYNST